MDEHEEKSIAAQIEKNNKLIAEAKETIERMRTLFRSLGADLDSGDNIFLNSKELSPEGRKQAEGIIAKLEQEYEERYQQYRETVRALPGAHPIPETLREAMAESQRRYNEAKAKERPAKKGVKRLRL
ncbi:MAG: hypothetical protein LBT98_04430 [Puniceicoccales bacterium]|jgi:hypothetical protein|nr:hypothetical protein [Puniceicoccales bacterium]